MANLGKTDMAWARIFEDYPVLESIDHHGFFEISSAEIGKYREARLMAKFDSYDSLPAIFKRHKLNILPVSRSAYVVGHFQLFKKLPINGSHQMYQMNLMDFETIDIQNITSEANAINVLILSKALDHFLNTPENFETFNSRMGSGPFNYFVSTETNEMYIESQSVQLEIDGGFENAESVVILEAKNVVNPDFNIRQLYFPYRLWLEKVNKPIRLVFSVYSNQIYRLFEYKFNDHMRFNSIELVKEARYTLADIRIRRSEVFNIVEQTEPIYNDIIDEDAFTPFPQADSLDRLISLLEILGNEEYLTLEEIAEFMEFNIRQSDYYYNACKYLELTEKVITDGVVNVVLTQNGKDFVMMGYRDRILFLCHLLARHHIFREGLLSLTDEDLLHFHNNNELYVVAKETIVNMMVLMNIVSSESTANRRAQTVRAWLFWLKDVITELD